MKETGNRLFGQGKWDIALETYREALVELPVRTKPGAGSAVKRESGEEKEAGEVQKVGGVEEHTSDEVENAADLLAELKVEEKEVARPTGLPEDDEAELEEVVDLRSVLFANVAACCLKMVSSSTGPWQSRKAD